MRWQSNAWSGVRTHAAWRPVDLKSTPLTTGASKQLRSLIVIIQCRLVFFRSFDLPRVCRIVKQFTQFQTTVCGARAKCVSYFLEFLFWTLYCFVHAKATAKGFEPSRAEPNGFLVHLLNHSDTLSWCPLIWKAYEMNIFSRSIYTWNAHNMNQSVQEQKQRGKMLCKFDSGFWNKTNLSRLPVTEICIPVGMQWGNLTPTYRFVTLGWVSFPQKNKISWRFRKQLQTNHLLKDVAPKIGIVYFGVRERIEGNMLKDSGLS